MRLMRHFPLDHARALRLALLATIAITVACSSERLLTIDTDGPPRDPRIDDVPNDVLENQAGDDDDDPVEVVGCGFAPASFAVPRDEESCDGPAFVRFDGDYELFVGVVTCESNDVVRVYLSNDEDGPFLPATDTAGHGQDHCELVNPEFTIGNEDSIGSGSCPQCSTGRNLPLEGVATFTRSVFGEPFSFMPETGEWSWQTSRLGCGVDVTSCAAIAVPDDIWLPEDGDVPPSSGVPCAAGEVSLMSFAISAADMSSGASDPNGPGFCIGDVLFQANGDGATAPCDQVHCATVLNGAGEAAPRLCTAFAVCEDGVARTTGFTW